MNRSRRFQQPKAFIHGGTYNGQNDTNRQLYQEQQQQQQIPTQKQPHQQQQHNQQQFPQLQPQQGRDPKTQDAIHPPQLQKSEGDVRMEGFEKSYPEENCFNNQSMKAEDESMDLTDENGKLKYKKIFLTRKKSSVRAREKKIRQNRQLRKAILPKNALMALNEVRGISMSDFTVNNNASGGFTAVVTVNNNKYEGRGTSKAVAKNNACEKALRDYVIAKMIRKPRLTKSNSDISIATMDISPDNEDSKDDSNKEDEDADDVPMVNLASFALFKLFSEWENEGFVIPEMHPAAQNGNDANVVAKDPKKPRSELPDGWEAMHPATLLCLMRPGITYTACSPFGDKPNIMQKLSIVVDEQEFMGVGRSKKIARRNAAVAVCNTLFGTNFEEENP